MTNTRLATLAITAVLLIAAAPALSANGGTPPVTAKTLHVEQLGPKHLLAPRSTRIASTTSTARIIPITARDLLVEELGPKYLLGPYHLRS